MRGTWLFYTLTLGSLSFWGAAFVLWLLSQQIGVDLFVGNAELAVYSAGLLGAAIPIMQREIKDSPFKHPRWFLAISVLVLVASGLMFASVTISAAAPKADGSPLLPVNSTRVLVVSIVIAIASLALCFFTELINNVRMDLNYRGMRDSEVNALGAKVTKLVSGE